MRHQSSASRLFALTLAPAVAVVAMGWGGVAGQSPGGRAEATKDAHGADRAAIRAVMTSFEKAFEAGDAAALVSHWTGEGEYRDDDGMDIQGRDALALRFKAFFAKWPKPKAEVEPESLRFLSRDVAIETGKVSVRLDPATEASPVLYEGLFVRENGRWLLASLRESADDDSGGVQALDWLVGEWKSKEGDADIASKYSWDENKKFLQVRFTIKEKDRELTGLQVLGDDPADGALRAWIFEAGGGVGEAVWSRDGNHWTAEASGALADGRTLTSTNVLRRIDNDTFTWQSVNRRIGDDELPDLPPVKVTRVKAK